MVPCGMQTNRKPFTRYSVLHGLAGTVTGITIFVLKQLSLPAANQHSGDGPLGLQNEKDNYILIE